MKKGTIVSLVTLTGEFLGKFVDETPAGVTIGDPRMLVHGEQGMGFAHGVCATGKMNPKEVMFYNGGLVFMTESNAEIEKAYIQATSGIII